MRCLSENVHLITCKTLGYFLKLVTFLHEKMYCLREKIQNDSETIIMYRIIKKKNIEIHGLV